MNLRKARTRTLIQIGGLVEKAGLLPLFDIQTGQDLQSHECLDHAAALLGFLITGRDTLFEDLDDLENLDSFKNLGLKSLKYGLFVEN